MAKSVVLYVDHVIELAEVKVQITEALFQVKSQACQRLLLSLSQMLTKPINLFTMMREHLVQITLQHQGPLFLFPLFDLRLLQSNLISYIPDHYNQLLLVVNLNIGLAHYYCSEANFSFLFLRQLDIVHGAFNLKGLHYLIECEHALPQIRHMDRCAALLCHFHLFCHFISL